MSDGLKLNDMHTHRGHLNIYGGMLRARTEMEAASKFRNAQCERVGACVRAPVRACVCVSHIETLRLNLLGTNTRVQGACGARKTT